MDLRKWLQARGETGVEVRRAAVHGGASGFRGDVPPRDPGLGTRSRPAGRPGPGSLTPQLLNTVVG